MAPSHRLAGGSHRRYDDEGNLAETFTAGDPIDPTPHELEVIGDKLVPVGGASAGPAPQVTADFSYEGAPMSSRTALAEAVQGELDTEFLEGEPENATGYSAKQVRAALEAQAEADGEGEE